MTGRSIAYLSCATPIWITFGYKLRDVLHGPDDPMRRTVCATLFSIAGILTASAPATIGAINNISSVQNLAFLVSFSLVVTLSASAWILVVYWHEPPEKAARTARRGFYAYASIILCMIVLFLAGDAPIERRTDFETYYATTPYMAEFTLLYLLAQAVTLVSVAWRCWHWARVAGRPWLKRGLRLITIGAVCGVGVSVSRTTAVAARWAGADWDVLNTRASVVFAILGLTVAALGFTLPTWDQQFTRAGNWMTRFRGYRGLYPLWDALRTAAPSIVLPVRIPWWDFELRLTRRLAEINDGRLALRPHIDHRIRARALRLAEEAGLPEADAEAVAEAAQLMGAIVAKQADIAHPPDRHPHGTVSGTAHGVDELAWLSAVARAFSQSPIAAEAVSPAGGTSLPYPGSSGAADPASP
ncbi:MAB_1171c family putative transporter [Streptomyces sp. RKCA744]|uniref:MAB_1171c family putative transporter n=1 Tax=Streptomyces sp. RKCA744 TaxID=2959340 RepID=UPI0020A06DC7|nr:MAB_1171c family putative transporter [Streptomyces sp. RKCA744]MCO8308819.1 hypothetical protein [Streptomyces sp. RKCA744]